MIATLVEYKDAAPAVGAIIGLVSALVALTVFGYTRRANRRRATLDMVLKTSLEDAGRARYSAFKDLMRRVGDKDDPTDIIQFADTSVPTLGDKKTLVDQLNEYELIALGIRRNIFDEDIYKLWFQGQFERDYESLCEYIAEIHKKRPSVYSEVSWLYVRWKRKPHPKNKPNFLKRTWWAWTENGAALQHYLDTRA